jgi:hypothetical protein
MSSASVRSLVKLASSSSSKPSANESSRADVKEQKRNSEIKDEYVDVISDEKSAPGMAKLMTSLLRMRPSGRLSRNAIYPFEVNFQVAHAADAGGVVTSSVRWGNTALWPAFTTLSLIFSRFRVKHAKIYHTLGPSDTSSGTTPHNLVVAADMSDNSLGLSSLALAWEIPGSQMIVLSNEPSGGGHGKIKPALSTKIKPEQEWFDVGTATQRGCFCFYGTGFTANATSALYSWVRLKTEFSSILI